MMSADRLQDTRAGAASMQNARNVLSSFSFFPAEEQTYGAVASAPKRLALDPICGAAVSVAEAAAHVVYRGMSYYFCSEACHRRFTWQAGRSGRGAT